MKYVLLITKWVVFYVAVGILVQVKEGFMSYNAASWQFWTGFVLVMVAFELYHQEVKLWRR